MTENLAGLEELLSYDYSNQNEITEEMRQASRQKRQELSCSIQGVEWFLSNVAKFTLPTTFIAAFQCFQFRLKYFPEEFMANLHLLTKLTNFLFGESVIQMTNDDIINELSKTQASLAILVYPTIFPQLLAPMQSFPHKPKIKFVSQLCHVLILPTVKNVVYFQTVKKHLRENQLQNELFEILKAGIANQNADALYGVAYLTRWIDDFSYLMDENFLNSFLDVSKDQIFSFPILELFSSISQRGVVEEFRHPLLQNDSIFQRISYYLQTYPTDFNLILACAKLISTLGYLYLDSPELTASLLQPVISFFSHPNDQISDAVSGYLSALVRQLPDSCGTILPLVVQRISQQFAQNPLLTYDHYLGQRLLILKTCFQQHPDVFWQMYDALSEQELSTETLSAYLIITNYILRNKIPFDDRLLIFFGKTRDLLFVPTIENEHQFYPIYGSLQTFLYRTDDISKQYNSDALKQLVSFSKESSIPDEIRKRFHGLFLRYAQTHKSFLAKISKDIECLLQTRSPELASVVSFIVGSNLPTQRINYSNRCIAYLTDLCSTDANIENIKFTLSFFEQYTCPENEEVQAKVVGILTQLAPFAIINDELCGLLFSAVAGLGSVGVQFYVDSLLPNVNNASTLQGAANAALIFLRILNNDEAKTPILSSAVRFVSLFIDITREYLMMPLSYENDRQSVPMIKNCYAIFVKTYEFLAPSLDQLIAFTRQLMIEKYESFTILPILFRFLKIVSQASLAQYAATFAGPSLYFILSPSFNPNIRDWDIVIQNLSEFHAQLITSYEQFSASIKQTFDEFEFPPDFLQEYQIALEKDQREIVIAVKDVFTKLLKYRNFKVW